MSNKKGIAEENINIISGGKSKGTDKLNLIDNLLDEFIEKHGGQYLCVIVQPLPNAVRKKKFEVAGSGRVTVLPSKSVTILPSKNVPFGQAAKALLFWLNMRHKLQISKKT